MSKIDKSAIHDFVNGEVVTDVILDQVVELLRVANNDNYDRLIKSYQVLNTDGTTLATQNLDTVINYLKFKPSAGITLALNTATSTVTIGVDTNVVATKDSLDAHKVSNDHDTRYYTQDQVDTMVGQAAVGNPPDNTLDGVKLKDATVDGVKLKNATVDGVKLKDGTVDLAKLSFDPATQAELDAVIAGYLKGARMRATSAM